MSLLGRANWWLLGWLDSLLPHLDLEGAPNRPADSAQPDREREPMHVKWVGGAGGARAQDIGNRCRAT